MSFDNFDRQQQKEVKTNVGVDISKCTDIACKCGNTLFYERVKMKKVSSVLSPTGKEMILELRAKYCTECDEQYIPKA